MSTDRSLHLKCSPGAIRRVNALIAATRAHEMKGSLYPLEAVKVELEFNSTKSRFLSFIADLEQRVSK